MRLRVVLPTHIELDEEVDKVKAEALNGAFTLLPKHVDFVAILAQSLLAYEANGTETFLAIDGGTLVKCGPDVFVSAMSAVRAGELGEVRHAVDELFKDTGSREQRARSAVDKMQADFVRRYVELEREEHG
jgi:F-type H+-transporting ATPase subunit epsilon